MLYIDKNALAIKYIKAKKIVFDQGYFQEIDYYDSLNFDNTTEKTFLKEMAWVILSSGMNEKIIRRKFNNVSNAFMNWSVKEVNKNHTICRQLALEAFHNTKKIDAILYAFEIVYNIGIETIKKNIKQQGVSYLQTFPYIGQITAYHIAKNLGLNFSKPDRHLCRIAEACGYNSVHAMCKEISQIVGDDEKTIDLVIWRFATINQEYISFFVQ